MLGAKLGHFLDSPLGPIAKRIPLSPNILTIVGFLITVVAALVIPNNLRLGGVLILIGGIFDMLDGIVARAGSEGLGESCNTGIMERPERIIFLIFATMTGWLVPVLWIMLILTHITVVQRIYHVWKKLKC